MENEDYNLDAGEWSSSPEAAREQSEKQRESAKKAQSQLQKTQKDEKKAKSDNDDLFQILSKFIQNPLYEELIPSVVILLEKGIPSRCILVIISLVYPEAVLYMLSKLQKHDQISRIHNIHRYPELTPFHENQLDVTIRDWVSFWMLTSKQFLTHVDASVILNTKLVDILSTEDRQKLRQVLGIFFHFFFHEKNVDIHYKKAETYSDFILLEFEKEVKLSINQADVELKTLAQVDVKTLFGV